MKTVTSAVGGGSKRAMILLSLVAIAVTDHVHGQNQASYTSLYDAISKIPDYSTLKAVVDVANLSGLLSNPNLPAILLAPDNTAFQNTLSAFPGATGLASNPQLIQSVLTYHLLPVTTPSAQLNLTTQAVTLPSFLSSNPNATFLDNTLSNVTFRSMPGNTYYAGGLPPGGLVNLNDSIVAGQGRIYTLTSGILIPPSKILTLSKQAVSLTIAELLQNTPGFTNLTALILADPVLSAFANNPDNAVTVFAPPDTAFVALFQRQGLTLDGIKGTLVARRILLNHIIPLRPYTSNQLVPPGFTDNTVPPFPTASATDMLRIAVAGNPMTGATVQGGGNSSPINVTAFNIPAGKSVAHVIAGIILPNETASATPPGAVTPPGEMTPPGTITPPGAMTPPPPTTPPPPGIVAPPGAVTPPGSVTPPGTTAPTPAPARSPPVAASISAASTASMKAALTWLLTTLLGAAMLLGFVNM